MKKEDINVQVKLWMEEGIQKVLNGKVESIELPHARPGNVIKYLESIGCEDCDEMDTNGWQWDYWLTVRMKGNKYMLSGDGYYESSATFSLDKDE